MQKLASEVGLRDIIAVDMQPDTAFYEVNDLVRNPEKRPPQITFNLNPLSEEFMGCPLRLTVDRDSMVTVLRANR